LRREGIALGVPARLLREMPAAGETTDKDQPATPSSGESKTTAPKE
jgi:hypothetical protein